MGKTVRTTIVGGRPPADGLDPSGIPRGIEVLLKKASVDETFRELLLAEPATAATRIGLELAPAESAMLKAVTPDALSEMVSRVSVSREQRPAFLGQAAAMMLAALGVGLGGCDNPFQQTRGAAIDRPRPTVSQPAQEEKAEEGTGEGEGNEPPPPPTRGHSVVRPPSQSEYQ